MREFVQFTTALAPAQISTISSYLLAKWPSAPAPPPSPPPPPPPPLPPPPPPPPPFPPPSPPSPPSPPPQPNQGSSVLAPVSPAYISGSYPGTQLPGIWTSALQLNLVALGSVYAQNEFTSAFSPCDPVVATSPAPTASSVTWIFSLISGGYNKFVVVVVSYSGRNAYIYVKSASYGSAPVDMHLDRDFRWYLLVMHGLAWNDKVEVHAVTRVTTHEDDPPDFESTAGTPATMSEDEARARLGRLGVVIPALAYFNEKEGGEFAGEAMTTLSAQWRRAHDTPPAWEDLLSEPDDKPCIRDGLVVIRRPRRWEVYQQQGQQAMDHADVRMLYVDFWLKTRYQYEGERTRMHDAYAKVDHSRTEGAITMAGHGWQAA